MKEFSCVSDIASVLIGNRTWTFAVPNHGGDGETMVRIYDSNKEFVTDPWAKSLDYISSAQGEFGIFGYDCDYEELRRGDMTETDALCTLRGRYGIYRGYYKVAFVKWKD